MKVKALGQESGHPYLLIFFMSLKRYPSKGRPSWERLAWVVQKKEERKSLTKKNTQAVAMFLWLRCWIHTRVLIS